MAAYSAALAEKPHVVVLTKRDLLPRDAEIPRLRAPGALAHFVISSAAHEGLEHMVELLWIQVDELRRAEATEPEAMPWEAGAPVEGGEAGDADAGLDGGGGP